MNNVDKLTDIFLKNQEKAEKWDKYSKYTYKITRSDNAEQHKILVEDIIKNLQTVERLKKRIAKDVHECDCEYGGCYHSYAEELQKILGGDIIHGEHCDCNSCSAERRKEEQMKEGKE